MTHIKMVVNGKTVMDGELGNWQEKPPTAIAHMLKAGKTREPYLQAALGALLEAAMKDSDALIEADTTGNGWSLRVTHKQPWAAGT